MPRGAPPRRQYAGQQSVGRFPCGGCARVQRASPLAPFVWRPTLQPCGHDPRPLCSEGVVPAPGGGGRPRGSASKRQDEEVGLGVVDIFFRTLLPKENKKHRFEKVYLRYSCHLHLASKRGANPAVATARAPPPGGAPRPTSRAVPRTVEGARRVGQGEARRCQGTCSPRNPRRSHTRYVRLGMGLEPRGRPRAASRASTSAAPTAVAD